MVVVVVGVVDAVVVVAVVVPLLLSLSLLLFSVKENLTFFFVWLSRDTRDNCCCCCSMCFVSSLIGILESFLLVNPQRKQPPVWYCPRSRVLRFVCVLCLALRASACLCVPLAYHTTFDVCARCGEQVLRTFRKSSDVRQLFLFVRSELEGAKTKPFDVRFVRPPSSVR